MSERIPCKNPECDHTILPSTAERTGGLCMPCAQAIAAQERAEYIQKNRRDVDAFAGITDPVAILQIIHQPRQYDPLVHWLDYPTPVDELYSQLTPADQARMVTHATTLIRDGHIDEAENILLCLAAFTEASLDASLRAMVSQDIFWPTLPFVRAPADVRDRLLQRVEQDADNRDHILSALAWLGDTVVAHRFALWRENPPAWAASLYWPPHAYAHIGGWELDAQGQRRNLYFPQATHLVAAPERSNPALKTLEAYAENCPHCHNPLIRFLEFTPAAFDLPLGAKPLQLVTCPVCSVFQTTWGKYNATGHGQLHPKQACPEDLPDTTGNWAPLPQNQLVAGKPRRPLFAAEASLPTTFSQIGGLPAWEQDPAYPQCPDCGQTMFFLAQFDHADIEKYGEGKYYAFICPDCRSTATHYQQT